jgi:small conductance mechanosensitive channel
MSTASEGSGYIYEMLHGLGVDQATAQHVQDLVLRPLTVVLFAATTFAVARLGARIIRRSLGRLRSRAALTDAGRASRIDTVARIAVNVWRMIVDTIGFIVILSVVGVNLTPFLAGATVVGATIGFGAQSLVRDFLSGFLMLLEDQYRIGDAVLVNEVSGTVVEVSLRVTRLRDIDGTDWYIPNGQILKLGNRSRHWSRAVISAQVGLDVGIPEANAVIQAAVDQAVTLPVLAGKLLSNPRVLGVSQVGATSITIDVEIRTTPLAEAEVHRALLEAVTNALKHSDMLPDSPS